MRERILVVLVSQLVTIALIVLAFVLGGLVSGTGLHDPDTCWLMALGRYVFENLRLPASDPFSYTFANLHRPFVMYQWGTELVFYTITNFLGLTGLVMVSSVLAVMTFMTGPLIISKYLRGTRLTASALVFLLVLAACFHILIRPEIISYALLMTWAGALVVWRAQYVLNANSDGYVRPVSGKLVWLLPLIMLIWANCHSAFTLGLDLAVLSAIAFSYKPPNVESQRGQYFDLVKITVASLIATLINPYGLQLWAYLPSLYFAPINAFIDELRPIAIRDLGQITYWPFLFLAMTASIMLARSWQKCDRAEFNGRLVKQALVLSTTIVTVSILAALSARRMISFTAIVIVAEALYLSFYLSRVNTPTDKSFWRNLNSKLEGLFQPGVLSGFLSLGISGLFGAYIVTARVLPPTLPQASKALAVPTRAIEKLVELKPARLFNDAQFGDVLLWQSGGKVPVFIDTRYDMYGNDFARTYQKMRFCEPDCDKLLDSYDISDVFVPPKSKLAKMLKEQRTLWKTVYEDDAAVVMTRVANTAR